VAIKPKIKTRTSDFSAVKIVLNYCDQNVKALKEIFVTGMSS